MDCGDITETDFGNNWSFAKYMFSGKFYGCFKLADKWAPEAIESAKEGLQQPIELKQQSPISCATEVVKKMEGSQEESVMVAGFAGGLGLSGNACGALAATIWKTILELIKKDEWKPSFKDPVSEKIIERFYEATDYKMECHEICGKRFNTVDEHSEYIKNGGCDSLINVLAQS
ncbi:C-GCAxxG-C-C family (seleno)protein [Candidatus Neomarinimicrobiota bacterium]